MVKFVQLGVRSRSNSCRDRIAPPIPPAILEGPSATNLRGMLLLFPVLHPSCISLGLVNFSHQAPFPILSSPLPARIPNMALKQIISSNALPALVVLFVLWRIVVTVRAYLRLRAFKGPWIASVSSIWLVRAVNKGHLHLKTNEVLRKYGVF